MIELKNVNIQEPTEVILSTPNYSSDGMLMDVVIGILSNLRPSDLAKCCQVSHKWNDSACSNVVWRLVISKFAPALEKKCSEISSDCSKTFLKEAFQENVIDKFKYFSCKHEIKLYDSAFSDNPSLFCDSFLSSVCDEGSICSNVLKIASYLNGEIKEFTFEGLKTPLAFLADFAEEEELSCNVLEVCLTLGAKPDFLPGMCLPIQPTLLFHVHAFAEPAKAAKLLLDAGADANLENSLGQTFLEFAAKKGVGSELLKEIKSYI